MAKPNNRRQEILQVATNLFLTQDYEQTTMADIMEALQIAKGTIYHYFNSKEALFEAVIEDVVKKNIDKMESVLKNSSGTALQKLELLTNTGRIANENENILEQLHTPANNALHSRMLATTLMKQAPLYAQVIEQGCREGVFTTDSPLECAEFLLSGIQFLTDMGIYPWQEAALQRRIEAFPRLLEQFLHAPSGSFQFLFNPMQS